VSFAVPADAYDRFMGRYSVSLAPKLAEFAGISAGQRVLDVGCGPGALTAELVRLLGASSVSAVDPSAPFVAAIRERYPEVAVEQASAETLPFADDTFAAAIAQLVVHFMSDPVGGLREMARVTRPGGVVAACVWDHAGGKGPLSLVWETARELDPQVEGEAHFAGAREGHLAALFADAGLHAIEEVTLSVTAQHPTFDDWWEPYTLGVGPIGTYVAGLDPDDRDRLRDACRERLPDAPFATSAHAWAVRGTV
jgi:ubiquinone/menaquinone biosynthesis C-methylase UbiE